MTSPSPSVPGCFPFPQALESCLAVLPRPGLRFFEIHGLPGFIPDSEFAAIREFWRGRKVALVRQTACLASYEAAPAPSWMETALTTKHHPGPLALLADLGADFIVVRQAAEEETFAWRGKHAGDPDPAVTFRRMEEYRRREEEKPGVVSCADVPWDNYDLVVCLDLPVPTRIVEKTRRPLWAYYSVEAGGPLAEASQIRACAGYHLFLNQHFRRYRARPANRAHMLEFPFSFQSRHAWTSLQEQLGCARATRAGVVADRASGAWVPSSDQPDFSVLGCEGRRLDLAGLVRLYAAKKYALRLDPHRRWGNWLIEVVQSGCLFLGRPDTLDNLSPLFPGLAVRDFRAARLAVDALEGDPGRFAACREGQAALVEHLAFRRPLADLTRRLREFLR